MVRRKLVWLLMVTCLLALVLAACGEAEEAPTEPATAIPAVGGARPSPAAPGTPAAPATPAASPSPAAAVTPSDSQDGGTPAQGEPSVVIGLDMDPAGNSCPDDGSNCSLGTIDLCLEVASGGGVIEFDIFLEGLPSGDSVAAWQAAIDGWPGTITDQVHGSGTVNLPAQPGSSIIDTSSDEVPDSTPPHFAIVIDLGTSEFNPPFTHGVLGRYTLDTNGVADGLYGMTLSDVVVANDPVLDLCDLYSCTIWDANFSPQYGLIAIGMSCPASP